MGLNHIAVQLPEGSLAFYRKIWNFGIRVKVLAGGARGLRWRAPPLSGTPPNPKLATMVSVHTGVSGMSSGSFGCGQLRYLRGLRVKALRMKFVLRHHEGD